MRLALSTLCTLFTKRLRILKRLLSQYHLLRTFIQDELNIEHPRPFAINRLQGRHLGQT